MRRLLLFLILFLSYITITQADSNATVVDEYSPKIFQQRHFSRDAPKYGDYKVPVYQGVQKKPAIKRGSFAYEYRTEVKNQASHGIDFAGHYRVTLVSLGYGLYRLVILDAITGKAYSDSKVKMLQLSHAGDWGYTDLTDHIVDRHLGVGFRKNSSLFIVAGSAGPSDDEQSALGIYYYLWKKNQMKLLHFVPYSGRETNIK